VQGSSALRTLLGAYLEVRETWVCGAPDTPRSDAGSRRLSFGELVADELFQHRARSSFKGDDERCSAIRTSAAQ